jgi:class III poly(R)-hydroxyalkanoic acid synthase PhaE subunit
MSNDPLFNDNWLKLQREYWDSLADMSRRAMTGLQPTDGGPSSDSTGSGAFNPWGMGPWQTAMEQWWRALIPGAAGPAQDFMQRLMDQGKVYFNMVEQFSGGKDGTDAMRNGWDMLNKTLNDMQKGFGSLAAGQLPGDDTMRRMMGFWEMPVDTWQRMMSSLSPMMPGDLLRNMPHDAARDNLDRVLSAPGLGYMREEQSQYQDLIRRSMDYQRALQEYTAFYGQLGVKAVERMREFLTEQTRSGKPIESVRFLYDNWVGCCEAVYEEEVATDEYSRIHGELVNALMALKKRMSIMVDENLGAMNMPTRSELRTLQDRLQETRRENKQLRQEINQIKRRVASLPAGDALPRSAPPAITTGSNAASASAGGTATKKKVAARKKTPSTSG